MRHLPVLLAIMAFSLNAVGQDSWVRQRDSLLKVLSGCREDSNKALVMTYLGMQYAYNKRDSAVYYLKEVYKLSLKVHYVRGMVDGLTLQAGILSDEDTQDEAIALDSEAVGIATKAQYRKGLAAIYNNIAIPYNLKGDHAASVEYYLKAATLDEDLHDEHNLAMAYANIGGVYNEMKESNRRYGAYRAGGCPKVGKDA
jgi:tetratricopeptide (TPR) repeat protein